MENYHSNSRRLAYNTVLLYIRTSLTLFIGLFTSRVLLDSLGIENYGIYNIVGGFIAMFSIITGTLTATTQRYINFELGKNNGNPLKVFGACMGIHFILAVVMLILFESFGIWFLNTQLSIPENRIYAANWCFQISVATSIVGLFSTPYQGVIVAHERMKAFAYISLQDAILKLLICYVLYISIFDKLIVFSLLFSMVVVWNQIIYVWYCRKHFPETKVTIVKDTNLYKSMFNFAGMNFIGAFAHIMSTQGVNVILNIFFGVIVNAARGIANQVQGAISRFVNDFMSALNPQITKEYAAGNKEKSMDLCFRGSKFSFYLLVLMALPIFVRAHEILKLWLIQYPDFTVEFLRLTLLISMLGVLSSPLITEIMSTGNLTKTTWWIGGTRLLILPLVYISFKFGFSAIYAYYIIFIMDAILLFVRLKILDSITGMTFLREFTRNVLIKILLVFISCLFIVEIIDTMIPSNLVGLLMFFAISVLINGIIVLLIGMTKSERTTIVRFINSKIKNYVSKI